MICPCKDCEKKGCGVYHSQCKEYQEFVEWRKLVNKAKSETNSYLFSKPKKSHRTKKNMWH